MPGASRERLDPANHVLAIRVAGLEVLPVVDIVLLGRIELKKLEAIDDIQIHPIETLPNDRIDRLSDDRLPLGVPVLRPEVARPVRIGRAEEFGCLGCDVSFRIGPFLLPIGAIVFRLADRDIRHHAPPGFARADLAEIGGRPRVVRRIGRIDHGQITIRARQLFHRRRFCFCQLIRLQDIGHQPGREGFGREGNVAVQK